MRNDLTYAARVLARQPGYAAMAILTMALGIGATTTLFSVAYGVLLKPLPFPEAGRLVRITESRKGQQGRIRGTISNGAYLSWRDSASTAELGGYSIVPNAMTILTSHSSDPVRVTVGRLTASMFDVLRVAPVRGRAFLAGDEVAGSGAYPNPQVIILSYGLWRDMFDGRGDAVGETIRVDDMAVTIVGVMPRGFAFPDRDTRAWLPMPIGSVIGDNNVRRMQIFGGLARLEPGIAPEQAAAEGTSRARTAPDPGFAAVSMFGSTAPSDIAVTPAAEAMTADVRPAIELLLAAVVLLLATATANVGSLQLARATARRRELAVRAAIGAGRARLVHHVVVESGVIGIAGGVAGVLLTLGLHRVLPSILPSDFPRIDDITVNLPVLGFAVVVSIAASVACAVLPSLAATRVDIAGALAEHGGGTTAGAWRSRAGRLRTIVMAGQIAAACVLLTGSALLIRSFVELMRADRGYDPTNLLTARVDLPRRYDPAGRIAFCDAVVARMRAMGGVTKAAVGNALPLLTQGDVWGSEMPVPGDPAIKQQVRANFRMVSPDYFAAMRIRLLEGRLLAETDTPDTPPVLVVDRAFARRYLGSVHVGARIPIKFGDGRPDATVVGVVDDMRQGDVLDPQTAEMFVSYRQTPAWLQRGSMVFVVRTAGDPIAALPMLRTAVHEQDPDVALDSAMTMEERLTTSLAKPRLYALLLTGLAVAALTIAGVGLFGVLSYAVAQRSREIGVRAALGAQLVHILGLVARQAVAVVASGLAVGILLSVAASRFVATFLYGVTSHDGASFAASIGIVIIVATVACAVPAWRAAKVDPLVVLRVN